jgi:hypothetical protein
LKIPHENVQPTVVDDNGKVCETPGNLVQSMGLHADLFASAREFLDSASPGRPGSPFPLSSSPDEVAWMKHLRHDASIGQHSARVPESGQHRRLDLDRATHPFLCFIHNGHDA